MCFRRELANVFGPFSLCPDAHNHYDKQSKKGASWTVAPMHAIGGCATLEIAYESQEEEV